MSDASDRTWLDPQTRGQLYHFLASAYLQPLAPEALSRLTDPEVLHELSDLFGENAIGTLRDYAARVHAESATEILHQEFMDLFAVPTGRYVTPFEDVYRGASAERKLGPLLGEHAVAVQRLYRAAGGEVDENCRELPTHIGVELAFMSFLCAKEAAARCDDADASPSSEADASRSEEDAQRQGCATERYRALQGMFLREHLNAWFPRLNRAIQEQAASGLYRGLAELTEAVLERDAAWLLSEPPSGVAASTAVH